ncbi:glycosyltransferase [Gryllotalpicola kribbensis]|uniref:Glycosyltransferase n=1 Tax=Gryllotalpicola kribbensis TaxID=993084 RepID=A0ABP8AM82_9MICO
MRVLLWHVHGGWMDAFVQGGHDYLLPATPAGGPWGLGRGGRDWPPNAVEVAPQELRAADVDVVVLQRPEELGVAERLLGGHLGRDIPAVYLEHNTPRRQVPDTVHPMAGRGIPLVHVTRFNALVWDNRDAPVRVIDHGVPDPGYRYTGERARLASCANEGVRRRRVLGTDLLLDFAAAGPVDVFGIGADEVPQALGATAARLPLASGGDLPPARLREALATRRAYVHPARWTSLGLSLIEAMMLGMPALVLATTQAAESIPPEAGAVSLDVPRLVASARRYLDDPDRARRDGLAARTAALERFPLDRFLRAWDEALDDAVGRVRRRERRAGTAARTSSTISTTGPASTTGTTGTASTITTTRGTT